MFSCIVLGDPEVPPVYVMTAKFGLIVKSGLYVNIGITVDVNIGNIV